MERFRNVRIDSSSGSSPNQRSYIKSPLGIIRLAIIISEIAFCISFAFIKGYKSDIYYFYLSIAGFTGLLSIIIYLLTYYQAFSKVSPFGWIIMMISSDLVCGAFTIVDGIAFAALTSEYNGYTPLAFCSFFSFLSTGFFVLDVFLWNRSNIQL